MMEADIDEVQLSNGMVYIVRLQCYMGLMEYSYEDFEALYPINILYNYAFILHQNIYCFRLLSFSQHYSQYMDNVVQIVISNHL